MHKEKSFLTYNQQLRKLRNEKNIECEGTKDKTLLVRAGYFNIVNGYKDPFTYIQDVLVSSTLLSAMAGIFSNLYAGNKKRRKTGSRLSGTDSGRAGICGSNPAAVSKVSDGWICIEKPGRLRGRS